MDLGRWEGPPGGRDAGWRRRRLAGARVYVCTPIRPDLAGFADAVLGAGVDVIQLRDKRAEAVPLLRAAAVMREAADRHGALLAVNDRADVALAAAADILHLGQDDLPMEWARQVVGEEMLLGRSTHDLEQARCAVAEGWDYFAVGPVYPTATKPDRPTVGTTLLQAVAALDPPVPWFAIGGVDRSNLAEITAAGASRVVVVRAVTDATDPPAAAAELRRLLGRADRRASGAGRVGG
jgi:thiamine-phosphate pyrophosphorylase